MSAPRKHHFIPAFYLKAWCDPITGKLVEFTRPNPDKAPYAKDVSQEATGFLKDLYTLPSKEDLIEQKIETQVLAPLDNKASLIFHKMRTGSIATLTIEEYIEFSRFILSLAVRCPEDLVDFKDFIGREWRNYLQQDNEYSRFVGDQRERLAKWLDSLDANTLETIALQMFQDFFMSKESIRVICAMKWHIVPLHAGDHWLFASDRPLITTNGIGYANSYILLPISPSQYFFACSNHETFRQIVNTQTSANINYTSANINYTVVSRACRFVWGRNRSGGRYVARHMASQLSPSLTAMVRGRLSVPHPP